MRRARGVNINGLFFACSPFNMFYAGNTNILILIDASRKVCSIITCIRIMLHFFYSIARIAWISKFFRVYEINRFVNDLKRLFPCILFKFQYDIKWFTQKRIGRYLNLVVNDLHKWCNVVDSFISIVVCISVSKIMQNEHGTFYFSMKQTANNKMYYHLSS